MAFIIKRAYEDYFWVMEEIADPRAKDLFLMSSPLPSIAIIYLWFKFILHWGPDYMKDREPFDLKKIMIVYNIGQVLTNAYIVYYVLLARNIISWRCAEVDYSDSYWGRKFLNIAHVYFMLKIVDLFDTVFFVLRKKTGHISFLHTYHHFGMVFLGWIGTKFVGGGHSYFLGMANGIVHMILYCYYLLTAYDSKYGKLMWLKKFITQAQLAQFVFLLYMFAQLFFINDCKYPKIVAFFFVPQNIFMIILFGDFYVRNYILAPRRKKKLAEQTKLAEQAKSKNQAD